MQASHTLPPPITLYRPWWRRLAEHVRERWQHAGSAPEMRAFSDRDYATLGALPCATLRDIGAPGWLCDRRQAVRRIELDLMRL